jgi:uncharacterized phage protein (TIGR02220 family)
MKRFTDTEIWNKPWYRKLPPEMKCAWDYVTDHCDNVGVWVPDMDAAEFFIGSTVDWDDLLRRCNGNIRCLESGKWWLPDFCDFQYGELKDTCPPHRSYISLLKKHSLFIPYSKGSYTLQEKEKEKDKDSYSSKQDKTVDITKLVIAFLNEKAGTAFRDGAGHREKVKGMLKKGYTLEDMKKVIAIKALQWKDDREYKKYLRPSTLFRPSHFDDYLGEYETEMLDVES